MREAIRDVRVAGAVLSLSLFFFVYLLLTGQGRWGPAAPNMVPTVVAGALLLLSIALLATAIVRWRTLARIRETVPAPAPAEPGPLPHPAPWKALAFGAVTIAFLAALPWFGYLATTAIYVGSLALLFGARRPLTILLLMVLTPLTLWLFFEKYMIILLPPGRLFQ